MVETIGREKFNFKKTLFLFGTYTIGKEKVFLAAAKAFRTKLYAGKRKRRILQCLDLTEEEVDLITPNDKVSAPHAAAAAPAGRGGLTDGPTQETNFHVVEMNKVRFEQMEAIAKYWRNRFDAVIGFLPTGWCVARPGGASHQGKQKQATLTANAQVSRARAQMGRRRASKSMVIYEVRTGRRGEGRDRRLRLRLTHAGPPRCPTASTPPSTSSGSSWPGCSRGRSSPRSATTGGPRRRRWCGG